MMLKRPYHGDSEFGTETSPAQESKRSIRDVLGMFSMEDLVVKMEPFIRGVVRDEAERAVFRVLQPSFRSSFNQPDTSIVRGFLLHFANCPPSTIFTGSKIETEEGNPIRIELLDANSKTIISSGYLSCIKIEILVLDGDFGSDDRENWTENEFSSSILREREGRRPLVTGGDLNITLRAGIGLISDVIFTDNSSWQRSRKFRLGAKPAAKTSSEARIREARSEAFVVKDHRGELYKKHHPPNFNDEVWRLERIAKDGASHQKLAKRGINTVGKFLQYYAINPSELRKRVLGGGISNKIWDIIVEHASSCVLDETFYTYYETGQNFGLLFNSVYKVIGVTFDGQNFEPVDKLAPHLKALVENLKRQAYANVNNLTLIDARSIYGPMRPLACQQTESFYNPDLSLQQLEFAEQEQQELLLDFNTIESANCSTSLLQWPLMTSSELTHPDDTFQAKTSTWSAANTLIFSSGNEGDVGIFSSHPRYGTVHMSRIAKPKTAGWSKLRAAIKFHSVRRDIAAKRRWQSKILYVDY